MFSATQRIERAIVKKIVEDALELGYNVTHSDGEDYTITVRIDENTTKEEAVEDIMDELHATDEEYLFFFKGGKRIGSVTLIYGNDGHDVIADNTATDEVERILAGATELADNYAS